MVIGEVSNIINGNGGMEGIVQNIALLGSLLPVFAHVLAKRGVPGLSVAVFFKNRKVVPPEYTIIREIPTKELVSMHLTRNPQTGNWMGKVHNDLGREKIDGLPVVDVEIPDSARLDALTALNKAVESNLMILSDI